MKRKRSEDRLRFKHDNPRESRCDVPRWMDGKCEGLEGKEKSGKQVERAKGDGRVFECSTLERNGTCPDSGCLQDLQGRSNVNLTLTTSLASV